MRRRVDLGSGLVGVGAAAILASLFLDWYEPGLTGWAAFEVVDWGLAALGVAALVIVAGEAGGARPAGSPLAWVVGAALLLVCAEIIDPPPAVADGAGRDIGAWLALAGALAMSAGVALMLASISVTIDVAGRERRVRVAAVDAREEPAGGETPADGAAAQTEPGPEAEAKPEGAGGVASGSGPAEGPPALGPRARRSGVRDAGEKAGAEPEEPAEDPDRTQQIPVVDPDRREDA